MGFKGLRWTTPNLLPIIFVVWVLSTIWGTYTVCHLMHQLQIYTTRIPGHSFAFDKDRYSKGLVELTISQTLTAAVILCFLLAIFTDPGGVPNTPRWIPNGRRRSSASASTGNEALFQHESKRSGLPRFCKWCSCFKPDRCHHCRICRSCITRMDHHCPWIANCVGYRNHKYFLLLVLYSFVGIAYMFLTMLPTMYRMLEEETTFRMRFSAVFGMTMMTLMGSLLCVFLLFHLWLTCSATTTIEFCEKAYKINGGENGASIYDQGIFKNLQAVLGNNVLLWLLPIGGPDGDGTNFSTTTSAPNLATVAEQIKSDAESTAPELKPTAVAT